MVTEFGDLRFFLNEPRSTLIYDGDCSFCIRCVKWLKIRTRQQVECLPFQSLRERFPKTKFEDCERSIQWVDRNGHVFEGAEAIFRTLACVPSLSWPLWLYKNIPGFAFVAEWVYQIVSKNRRLLGVIFCFF
jgi:predicted DCC family thiol-disulfide oxidoreductase YuxK